MMIGTGVVLLVALVGLSWLNRRAGAGDSPLWRRRGRESVTLTGQHAVHVVEIGGKRLLIGTGPSEAPRVLADLGAELRGPT